MIRRFLNDSAVYWMGAIASRAVVFALTPLFTRVLTPEQLGAVSIGNTLTALGSLVLGLGLHAALSRYLPTATETERRDLLGTTVVLLGVAPLLALPLALGLSVVGPTSALGLPDYALITLGAWASTFPAVAVQLFVSTGRARAAAATNLALVALQVAACIVAVVVLRLGITGVFFGYAFAQVVVALGAFGVLARTGLRVRRELVETLLVFAAPVVLHLLANWVLSISDRLLLEHWFNERVVAVYSIAYLFNLALTSLTSSLSQALAPLFVRAASAGDPKHDTVRVGHLFVAAMLGGALFLALLSPELLHLVAPRPEYQEALALVPWLLAAGVAQGFYFLLSQGAWFKGATSRISLYTVFAAATNLVLNIAWIPRYGIKGAAWSTLAAYALLMVLQDRAAQKHHPMPWPYGRWAAATLVTFALMTLRFH